MATDKKSREELHSLWRYFVKQRTGVMALAKDSETGEERIAGINMTYVLDKSEKDLVYEVSTFIIQY